MMEFVKRSRTEEEVLCLSLTNRWRVDFEKTTMEEGWKKVNLLYLN